MNCNLVIVRPIILVVRMNTVEKQGKIPSKRWQGECWNVCVFFKILQSTYCWDATWFSWNHLSEHSNWLGPVWWIGLLWLNWAWNHLNWSLKRQSPEPPMPWLVQFSSLLAYSQNRREKCIDFLNNSEQHFQYIFIRKQYIKTFPMTG